MNDEKIHEKEPPLASKKDLPYSLPETSIHHENLRGYFKKSLIAHGILLIIAVITNFTFFGKPIEYKPTIKVDLVALPDVKKNELDKYEPATAEEKPETAKPKEVSKLEPVKPPEPKDDVMSLNKKKTPKTDLKSAIDRIKALADIENEVKAKSEKTKQKALAKGNELSKGDAMYGDYSDQASDLNSYMSRMQSKIRENWNLPVWLSKQDLSAKVVVFLDRNGFIKQTVFSKTSGNAQFDDYAVKTIKMSQPFGNPPTEINQRGITLGFPL